MILYKKYLCFISSDDAFGNKNLTRRVGSSARLGSAGAFRPDHRNRRRISESNGENRLLAGRFEVYILDPSIHQPSISLVFFCLFFFFGGGGGFWEGFFFKFKKGESYTPSR